MSELPDLSAQKPYALDQLAQLQGKIIRLSQSMVLQRARIERCRQSDLAAARDIYAELSKTREALVEALAQTQLFLMETEEYALAKVARIFSLSPAIMMLTHTEFRLKGLAR